jgi:hypothetical protein
VLLELQIEAVVVAAALQIQRKRILEVAATAVQAL